MIAIAERFLFGSTAPANRRNLCLNPDLLIIRIPDDEISGDQCGPVSQDLDFCTLRTWDFRDPVGDRSAMFFHVQQGSRRA